MVCRFNWRINENNNQIEIKLSEVAHCINKIKFIFQLWKFRWLISPSFFVIATATKRNNKKMQCKMQKWFSELREWMHMKISHTQFYCIPFSIEKFQSIFLLNFQCSFHVFFFISLELLNYTYQHIEIVWISE